MEEGWNAKGGGGGCQRASRNGTICAQRAPTCAIHRVLARKSEPLRPRKSQTTGHNLRKEPRCDTRTVAMRSSFQGFALQAPTQGSLYPGRFAEAPSMRRRSLVPTLLLDPGVDHKAAIAPRSIQIHGFARALRKRGSIAFCLRGPIKRGFAGPQNPSSSHSARVERTRAAENLRRSCRPPSLSAVPGKRATAAIERVPRRFEI